MLYTAGEVCRIVALNNSPLSYQTLDAWVNIGYLTPAERESGKQVKFSDANLLTVAVFTKLLTSAFGLHPNAAVGIAKAIDKVYEDAEGFEGFLKWHSRDTRYICIHPNGDVSESLLTTQERTETSGECEDEYSLSAVSVDVCAIYYEVLTRKNTPATRD